QLHLGENRGMRGAINAGIKIAKGEFLMRTDAHCIFGKGFDKIMTESCQPNWIMTATRYFLDPIKWEKMDVPPYIHEKLKDVPISETMAMQGSFWIMPKKWWDEVIVELDAEHYGDHYQDQHEMIF